MMRNKRKITTLTVLLLGSLLLTGVALALVAVAQVMQAIDWRVIGGGGSHAEAGNYALDYTIGQPVAGVKVSGNVELCTGFGCGVVVPGLPPTGADLSVSKSDSPDPVATGGRLTYTLSVANSGPADASGVKLTDTLPSGASFVLAASTQGSCSGTSTIVCDVGDLANGAGATVVIVVTAPVMTGTLNNTVSVGGGQADPNMGSNTATESTTVGIKPQPPIGPGGGIFVYTDTQGLTTTIRIPPGAVTGAITLVYTPVPLPREPISPGLRFAGDAFELDAYRNGTRLPDFTFMKVVSLTTRYSEADVAWIDEPTLKLYRWVPSLQRWQVVGRRLGESQALDTKNNVLRAWLRGLSMFGKAGAAIEGPKIFLPVVLRNK